jgi:sulfotransferase
MTKKIHFISGLPRSGSTLLCNILNQNPAFHATSTSGILEIILSIRNQWENVAELRASPNKAGKSAVINNILHNYVSINERPVYFDKSRAWIAYIELAEAILGEQAKILVPVRKITDILSSFENLYRKNAHEWQFPQEKSHFAEWQTVEGRADIWMRNDQPVGIAYNRIRDAISRGYGDRLLFMEFDHLTSNPKETMDAVYDFLEEKPFKHNFNKVKQVTQEDDDIHGIPGLHIIRSKVAPVPDYADSLIGPTAYAKFDDAQFWRQ